jgi:hypothetical protein
MKYKYNIETPTRIEIDGVEYCLEQGNVYELPSKNAYIASLIEQGFLTLVPDQKTKTKRT